VRVPETRRQRVKLYWYGVAVRSPAPQQKAGLREVRAVRAAVLMWHSTHVASQPNSLVTNRHSDSM